LKSEIWKCFNLKFKSDFANRFFILCQKVTMRILKFCLGGLRYWGLSKPPSRQGEMWQVVMGPGQNFDPGRVSVYGSGRVSHLWFGFEFGKFLLEMSNFQFFSLRVKKNLFELGQKKSLRAGSKSTWVKSGLASCLLRVNLSIYLSRN